VSIRDPEGGGLPAEDSEFAPAGLDPVDPISIGHDAVDTPLDGHNSNNSHNADDSDISNPASGQGGPDDVVDTGGSGDSGAGGPTLGEATSTVESHGSRPEQGPEPDEPLRLDELVSSVGAYDVSDLPMLPKKPSARVGLLGRMLLRIINVVPSLVSDEERFKFYFLAMTVLLNACVASVVVPVSFTVAYDGLSDATLGVLSVIGFSVVGIVDALIVGHWISYAEHFVNPQSQLKMPSYWSRIGALLPRLLFTGGLIFVLGYMLTLSTNAANIRATMKEQGIVHAQEVAREASQNLDKRITDDESEIAKATAKARKDLADLTRFSALTACERYAKHFVPGCSGSAGDGELAGRYAKAAEDARRAYLADQRRLSKAQEDLAKAKHARDNVSSNKDVAEASTSPSGLAAVSRAWHVYTQESHLPWYDRWRMDILIGVVDLVPLLMKFAAGITLYEADLWRRAHRQALIFQTQDTMLLARLKSASDGYSTIAERWGMSRVTKAEKLLEEDERRPDVRRKPSKEPEIPKPPVSPHNWPPAEEGPVGTPVRPSPNVPSSARVPRREDGPNPIAENRNANVGDIVPLPYGWYLLAARLTDEESHNSDVFIGVEVPGLEQRTAAWDNPIRAIKFSRLEPDRHYDSHNDPIEIEREFLRHFPSDPALLQPEPYQGGGDRLIYDMQYQPRGDLERFAYGQSPGRIPDPFRVEECITIARTVNRGLARLWESGWLHNDPKPLNFMVTGPWRGSNDPAWRITPHDVEAGNVVIGDWNFTRRIGAPYHPTIGIPVNALEGDPALMRWLLANGGVPGPSPLSIASDAYAPFATLYTLLSGGLSPTTVLLIANGWTHSQIVALDAEADLSKLRDFDAPGWPDILKQDPLSIAEITKGLVPKAFARIIDDGVRARPELRSPQIAGAGRNVRPTEVRSWVDDALVATLDSVSGAYLKSNVPERHEKFLWPTLPAPVGWPQNVLKYVKEYWPAYYEGKR
jgi:hypothetical protein